MKDASRAKVSDKDEERIQRHAKDWLALIEFIKYLPPDKYEPFSDTVKRVRSNQSEMKMDNLTQMTQRLDAYERVKLQSETFLKILSDIIHATDGTDAVPKIMPHVEELLRFLSECDAPEMTEEEARLKTKEQLNEILRRKGRSISLP
jgi:hypothetical protein